MQNTPILALMYDFDRTLSPKDMQEYGFIPGLDMTCAEFWAACDDAIEEHGMDSILAYMLIMLEKSRGKQLVTKSTLKALGADVELFPGVHTWFERINSYAMKKGLCAEHYIISSGLKEIIEGTKVAHEFKKIYAAAFCYDQNGVPIWPSMAVNYTSKTQFLFRINKGVLDPVENKELNEYMPEELRRVPFRNMIYIGDGMTDVPCMKLTKSNGGHSIAVYKSSSEEAHSMLLHGRVDFALPADYREGSELEKCVFEIADKVAAAEKTARRHLDIR